MQAQETKQSETMAIVTNVSQTAISLLYRRTLAEAANLARAGQLTKAQQLIIGNLIADFDAPSLDLLAKITVQQGNLLEAKRLWQQAVEIDPENQLYMGALRQINRQQKHPLLYKLAPKIALIATALVIVTIAAFILRKSSTQMVGAPVPEPQKSESLAQPSNVQPSVSKVADLTLSLPQGVSVKQVQNQTAVFFNEGLFLRNTRLQPQADELLTKVGQALGQKENLSIEIVGCTDNSPMPSKSRYTDNSELGMFRALSVFNQFKKASKFPDSSLTIRFAGESLSPYPNDTPQNRARNRTVYFLISEKQQ